MWIVAAVAKSAPREAPALLAVIADRVCALAALVQRGLAPTLSRMATNPRSTVVAPVLRVPLAYQGVCPIWIASLEAVSARCALLRHALTV